MLHRLSECRRLVWESFCHAHVAGMGLSVGDKATLVTLNSLGSSSYDSAKLWLSLAVLCVTATLFAAKVPGAPLMGGWADLDVDACPEASSSARQCAGLKASPMARNTPSSDTPSAQMGSAQRISTSMCPAKWWPSHLWTACLERCGRGSVRPRIRRWQPRSGWRWPRFVTPTSWIPRAPSLRLRRLLGSRIAMATCP